MNKVWKNLSVAKKIYGLVGIMALLICFELYTLQFAMTTLSGVRAFVGGESLWSKGQKAAISSLQRYARTGDPSHYEYYKAHIAVPLGDHKARLELEKPRYDFKVVEQGFIEGRNHPDDVPKMIKLLKNFNGLPYFKPAIEHWKAADDKLFELIQMGNALKAEIETGHRYDSPEIKKIFQRIAELDNELTVLEEDFSSTLGESSRWLEHKLVIAVLFLILIVEGTGFFLTIRFARGMSRDLKALNQAAEEVGKGNFDYRVPVHSEDELGRLADSINNMSSRLQNQVLSRMSAEEASKMKNLFLANVSHEIRTPLNAILGFAELLHSSKCSPEEKEKYFETIKRTGANLTAIINDILDVTRMEAGEVDIEYSIFSLSEVMNDLESIYRLKCEEKGLELNFLKQGNLADYIRSDAVRLRQILTNVLGNALKFTSRGSVRLTYGLKNDMLFFSVKDTGIGITEDQMSRLFQPFSQGDDSVRKKHGGTGLGLQISGRLARLMGGELMLIKSDPSRGSIFTLTLPYYPVNEAPKDFQKAKTISLQKDVQGRLQGKRVLVCEDSLDNQYLARRFLSDSGARVDLVSNGEEALSATLSEAYDVILMDMQMPVIDGFTATRELRQRGSRIPIIAVTGYAMKQDREMCFEAGCTEFLAKPFNRDSLVDCVVKCTESPGQDSLRTREM